MTAAHREETIDSKDQELLALIEQRKNMARKEQMKDIRKKIRKGIRDNKRKTSDHAHAKRSRSHRSIEERHC